MADVTYSRIIMWQEISKIGKKLVDHGLVESHFGNISVRIGNKMLITRSGSALDEITENSVVEVELEGTSGLDMIASSEAIVHREIYKNTSALAIIHAHCQFAVTLSLLADFDSDSDSDFIVPVDSEGQYFLHEVPIVKGGIGTPQLAKNTARALAEHKGAIIYSHGTFATGKILEEAYVVTTQIEHSCAIKYRYDMARK